MFDWHNDPTKGPDAFIDGNNGPDGGNPYMWGHVFWDKSGGINYFLCDVPGGRQPAQQGRHDRRQRALRQGGPSCTRATGCYLNFSYNKDWVVAQKWLTGVPEAQNIGANELDFSKLGIAG